MKINVDWRYKIAVYYRVKKLKRGVDTYLKLLGK